MKKTNFFALALLLTSGLVSPIAFAQGNSCGSLCTTPVFGAASDFDAFIFENFTAPSSDVEGRLAVGQDVILSAYSIGAVLPADVNRSDLIAGRDVSFSSGAVLNGGISYGRSYQGNASAFFVTQQNIVNFAQVQSDLTQKSDAIAALPINTIPEISYTSSRAFVTFAAQSGTNVFSIDARDLASAHTVTITGPSDAIVWINVQGSTASLSSFGMFFSGGVSYTHVLFNLNQATALTISDISVEASVLAPRARVSFPSGQLNGHLVAYSFTGSGQINHIPGGNPIVVPTPTCTPIATPEPTPDTPIQIPIPTPTPVASCTTTNTTHYVRDSFTDGAMDFQVGGNEYEIYGMVVKQIGDQIIVGFNSNFPITGGVSHGYPIGWGDFILNFARNQSYFPNSAASTTFAVKFADHTGSDQAAPRLGLYRNVTVRGNEAEHDGYLSWGSYLAHLQQYGQTGNVLGGLPNAYFNSRTGTPNSIQSGTYVEGSNFAFLSAAELALNGVDFSVGLGVATSELGSVTFGFAFDRTSDMLGTFTAHLALECSNDVIVYQDTLLASCVR
jgi:choice-of-anchor A domain-containing protein